MKILNVTPENIAETGIFCIKDQKAGGYRAKVNWYKSEFKNGLRLKIARTEAGEPMGFIEYTSAEFAWRPVAAPGYLFIHCIMVYPNKHRAQGVGDALIEACIADAQAQGKVGVAVMTSRGAWVAKKDVFAKNGFTKIAKLGRFELMAKKLNADAPDPQFINWETQQAQYEGWHLLYADQCPWHEKAVEALQQTALEHDVPLQVTKLKTAAEAQQAPSGFGTFSLMHDGKLLEDHYISQTRFENILKKELS
jgi:ribosomal protein S18 acetylase RimI-like enzyme